MMLGDPPVGCPGTGGHGVATLLAGVSAAVRRACAAAERGATLGSADRAEIGDGAIEVGNLLVPAAAPPAAMAHAAITAIQRRVVGRNLGELSRKPLMPRSTMKEELLSRTLESP